MEKEQLGKKITGINTWFTLLAKVHYIFEMSNCLWLHRRMGCLMDPLLAYSGSIA